MTTLTPDTVVGHHVLEEKLGEGGFGEVWRARRHPEAPPPEHRDEPDVVAVKIARNPGQAQTLSREAALLKKLDHPSIVRVFGVRASDHPPHFVMEYVVGRDLATILEKRKNRRLSWHTALPMFTQVTEALAAAHALDVAHGDIKPHNVLIRDEGDVVLTDFGLGRGIGGKSSAPLSPSLDLSHDAAASIAGTLAYMAPECKRGARPSKASDVYSLGTLFFQMLVGHTPRGAWRPLAQRGVRAPPALGELIHSMLAPMAPRRPADAKEVEALLSNAKLPSALQPVDDVTLRRCPQDAAPLHTANVGPVILDRCRRCGGTWFDSGEVEAVLKHLTGVSSQVSTVLAPRSIAHRPCPICVYPLHAFKLIVSHPLEDDSGDQEVGTVLRCHDHGLWMGADERQALLDAVTSPSQPIRSYLATLPKTHGAANRKDHAIGSAHLKELSNTANKVPRMRVRLLPGKWVDLQWKISREAHRETSSWLFNRHAFYPFYAVLFGVTAFCLITGYLIPLENFAGIAAVTVVVTVGVLVQYLVEAIFPPNENAPPKLYFGAIRIRQDGTVNRSEETQAGPTHLDQLTRITIYPADQFSWESGPRRCIISLAWDDGLYDGGLIESAVEDFPEALSSVRSFAEALADFAGPHVEVNDETRA